MEARKFVSIDCGKYDTKISYFAEGMNIVKKYKFRTKITPGATFADDMFDKGTFIVQIDDEKEIYKVGYNGKKEPDMETTKKTDIHRVCTMTGIACALRSLGKTPSKDVPVAIGIPFQIINIPEERMSYKEYILGEEGKEHVVRIKWTPEGSVHEVRFSLGKRNVYPEGIGVVYEYPDILDGTTAILDIGNLNTNHIYTEDLIMNENLCFTSELGGKIMIAGLAEELTSELGARVNEAIVASTLKKPVEERCLMPKNNDMEIQEKSRAIIKRYLLEHVKRIKKKCDTKQYPLDFMHVVCTGGTSKLIMGELREVFGENTFIPKDPEYANALGFLRKLCAEYDVELPETEQEAAMDTSKDAGGPDEEKKE